MLQFVELCVDLKKGKLAKDGLYQYKNTAQNTNVGTIEVSEAYRVFETLTDTNLSLARSEEIHRARRNQSHRSTRKSGTNTVDN